MNESIQYWVDLSDYDIDTAVAMLESKRYLYVVSSVTWPLKKC